MKQLAALFVAGALLGTLCDRMHLVAGVLGYPPPAPLFGQAWWVPLLMGSAGIALGVGHAGLTKALGVTTTAASVREVGLETALFVAAYAATAFLPAAHHVTLLALLGAWLATHYQKLRPWLVGYALGTALIGTAVEATLTSVGAFYYTTTTLLTVTLWLPALYLFAATAGSAFARLRAS